eukprot:2618671-Rhodomonas_salina.1
MLRYQSGKKLVAIISDAASTGPKLRYLPTRFYALSGTDTAVRAYCYWHAAVQMFSCLRACYTMSGTDRAYGAIRNQSAGRQARAKSAPPVTFSTPPPKIFETAWNFERAFAMPFLAVVVM